MKNFTPRKSMRLKDYDYSTNGHYFVTICTYNRKEILGRINNDQIILNQAGNIAHNAWLDVPKHHENIELDEFIRMPNHMHGIINIAGAGFPRPNDKTLSNIRDYNNGRGDRAPTLGCIIAYFKYQSTKYINQSKNTPGKSLWQRSFYDHVIRNDESLHKIREYICNNPIMWNDDENNINNYSVKVQAGLNPTGLC